MAVTIFVSKINNPTSRTRLITFPIKNVDNFTPSYDIPITPMPIPQQDDTQNILTKIEGNSTTITVSWLIKDEGSTNILIYDSSLTSPNDKYVGVSAKTIWEQLQFLDQFQSTSLTDVYMIEIADSLSNNVTTPASPYYQKVGFITKIDPNFSSSEPNTIRCTLSFIVGNVITAFEANTPNEPTGVSVTSGSAAHATVTWTAPANTGGGITGYVIYKKTTASTYDSGTAVSAGASPYTFSGLTSGIYYTFKVAAKSANGTGNASDEVSVKVT